MPKTCKLEGCECPCHEAEKGPTIVLTTSDKVGGCSVCNRHIDSRGSRVHKVYEVAGPCLRVRFCTECAKQFKATT